MQDVYLEAMKKKKQYRAVVLAMTFGFLMVGLLTVLLDYLLPFSAIILFPFLVLPYFIAMQMTLIQIDVQEFKNKNFYRMFLVGISPIVRRSFGLIKNILFAVLIYYLASQATMLIFGLIPQYSSLMSQLNESITIENASFAELYNTVIDIVQNNEVWKNAIFISTSISYGAAFMFFIYETLHNSLYALCKNSASLPNGRNKPVFKEVFKKYSRDYYKTYYRKEWYKVILVPIFYIGGILLAYFLDLPNLNIILGTAFAVIAIVLLIPNLMLYQEKMYVKMFDELSKKNFSNMQKVYSDLRGQVNLTKEQENALEDFMKQLEDAVKEKKENDNDENKSSDK